MYNVCLNFFVFIIYFYMLLILYDLIVFLVEKGMYVFFRWGNGNLVKLMIY